MQGQPQNIMQAFRMANDRVADSKNIDEMISAYDQVVSFCSGNKACRAERSTRRDMLLYWAYNHIAGAYLHKELPTAAVLYWEKALAISANNKQKAHVLEQMLDAVSKEKLHTIDKCHKILGIINQLTAIYKNKSYNADLRRITALGEKTLEILKKSETSW